MDVSLLETWHFIIVWCSNALHDKLNSVAGFQEAESKLQVVWLAKNIRGLMLGVSNSSNRNKAVADTTYHIYQLPTTTERKKPGLRRPIQGKGLIKLSGYYNKIMSPLVTFFPKKSWLLL